MRRSAPVLSVFLLLLLFLSGCVVQNDYPAGQQESLESAPSTDLDGDGSGDYFILSFSEFQNAEAGITLQRKVLVSAMTTAEYQTYNEITDSDLLVAAEHLDDFSNSLKSTTDDCSRKVGLLNVNCIDVETCSRLCSSASTRCRSLLPSYGDAIGASLISYGQTLNELDSLVFDSKRKVTVLRSSPEEKPLYLQTLRRIVGKVAQMKTNPVYSEEFGLCFASTEDFQSLMNAAEIIGGFSVSNESFHYTVLIIAEPAAEAGPLELKEVGLIDSLPSNMLLPGESIISHQEMQISEKAGALEISWESKELPEGGYAYLYEFDSATSPEEAATLFSPPTITVKSVDVAALEPANLLFVALRSLTADYFLSLGISLGIILSILVLLYTIVIIILAVIRVKIAGMPLERGVARALGRSTVSWKTDVIFAAIFILGGIILSAAVATQPEPTATLLEAPDIFVAEVWGAAVFALSFLGIFLSYLAVENYSKIFFLERSYGRTLMMEKKTFIEKVEKVKENLVTLEKMVEEYGKQGFDVSTEYDILASVSTSKADQLAKTADDRSKRMIDDYLTKLENGIERLSEKKRVAQEDWSKWSDAISKMLKESNEVYANSLVTVPTSLRTWALKKYAAEHAAAGLTFERDSLKKKEVTALSFVQQLMEKDFLRGAVVIKGDKVVVSEFVKGSGTVRGILTQKLKSYLRIASKQLGKEEPVSFAAIGKDTVLVLMADRHISSLLFVNRPHFKETIEAWKRNKMKIAAG